MRYILVDRILEWEKGQRIKAVKSVTLGEPFLRGLPEYPAALILEAIVQTGGILCRMSADRERMTVLGKISRADFPARAFPGDRIEIEVEIALARPEGNLCEGVAKVGDRVVGSARFLLPFLPPEMEPQKDAAWRDRRAKLQRALGLPPSPGDGSEEG
ncbi:MAG: hypothetical protein O7C98_00075 [Planctomycetota bacterium]|nr:hypothetical protein [Planctomycetota bacterium]